MNGAETMTTWLFATLCTTVTARSIVKLLAVASVSRAAFRAQVDVYEASVGAQAEVRVAEAEASSLVFPPAAWTEEGGL